MDEGQLRFDTPTVLRYNRTMKRILLLVCLVLLAAACDDQTSGTTAVSGGKLYLLFEETEPLTAEAVRTHGKCVAENIRIESERPSAYHLCLAAVQQNERLQLKFEGVGSGVTLSAACLAQTAEPNHNWNAASVDDYTDCSNGNLCRSGWTDAFWGFYTMKEGEDPHFSDTGLASCPLEENLSVVLIFSRVEQN